MRLFFLFFIFAIAVATTAAAADKDKMWLWDVSQIQAIEAEMAESSAPANETYHSDVGTHDPKTKVKVVVLRPGFESRSYFLQYENEYWVNFFPASDAECEPVTKIDDMFIEGACGAFKIGPTKGSHVDHVIRADIGSGEEVRYAIWVVVRTGKPILPDPIYEITNWRFK